MTEPLEGLYQGRCLLNVRQNRERYQHGGEEPVCRAGALPVSLNSYYRT